MLARTFSSSIVASWWEAGVSSAGEGFRSYVDSIRERYEASRWGEDLLRATGLTKGSG